jgi:succinate-acetate transporter protein
MIYAGLAGYYQSFAFLVTPGFGVTLSYSQPNELNTATAVMFLTWSIWFTFTTSLIALRSDYTIYLTLIFASVAITTGLVGTSHLVAATSEQVPAFRLQRVQILPCCEKIRH